MEIASVMRSEDDQIDATSMAGLLSAASRGDESAWRRIVDLYGRRVYALARSRCEGPDQAEEITQSVFVTIASKLRSGQYTEQGRFESWLFRVAMNRIRDHARRLRRQASVTDPDVIAALPLADQSDAPSLAPDLAALRAALHRLCDADREVIELRHHGGLSFRQIASLLGEPVGTLLARHHRALRKLREMLESEPPSPRSPSGKAGAP